MCVCVCVCVCVCLLVHVQSGTLTIQPCTPSFQDDHMIASVLLPILRPHPLSHAAIGRIEFAAKVWAMIIEFVAKVGAMTLARIEFVAKVGAMIIEFVAKGRAVIVEFVAKVRAVIAEFVARVGAMTWAAIKYHSPREIRTSECPSVFTT